MKADLQHLIDAVDVATNEKAIGRALLRFTKAIGFKTYAYFHGAGTDIEVVHNYPQPWEGIYREHQFSTIDPVVTQGRRFRGAFSWDADDWGRRGSSAQERSFKNQAIMHGIRAGFTVPVQGSYGRTIMMTFASDEKIDDGWSSIDPTKLTSVAMAIHYRCQLLDERHLISPRLHLTAQESLSLQYAADGFSTAMTGRLLGINGRTVQKYLDSARQKLEARNVTNAVIKAKERRLI